MAKNNKHYFLFTSCLSAAVVPHFALANPEGGSVVAGSAVITSSGNTVDIHQSTNRAIIDWRSFDIAPNETTRFHQPDASSHTLNRVNSMSRSVIEGTIQANGNITIVNPNGVFFSRGSTVDVGGLTATSADTTNANFMAGKAQHDMASANTAAEVRNDGTITVRDSGLVALVAPSVANDGVITAKLGKVHLASGDSFVMDVGGDGHMQVAMSQHTLQRQLVTNSGKISADGGYVALTAAAARDAVDSLITNTGVIEAKSVGAIQGKVVLQGAGSNAVAGNVAANKGIKSGTSTVVHAGIIDVSGKRAGEKGGKVVATGDYVIVEGTGRMDASGNAGGGTVLVGGDYQGNGETATALATAVGTGAMITVDALQTGNGGKAILWADKNTYFYGDITARGGALSGDGGFVEVSGKEYLKYKGNVNTTAAHGKIGTLLLDPTNIVIMNGTADGDDADGSSTSFAGDPSGTIGTVLAGDTTPTTLYESELEGIAAGTAINLQATNTITINDLTDNQLTLDQDITFTAANFTMNTGDTIDSTGNISFVTSGAAATTIGSLAGNGNKIFDIGSTGTATVSGVISGNSGVTKTGTGTLTLTGNNTYNSTTTLTGGTLLANHLNALGSGTLNLNGGTFGGTQNVTNNMLLTANSDIAGGSRTYSGTFTNTGDYTLTLSSSATTTLSGTINLSNDATNRTLTVITGGNHVISGVIQNGGGSTASNFTRGAGGGTLRLGGNNTYSGTTTNLATTHISTDTAFGTSTLNWAGGYLTATGAARTIANDVNLTADSYYGSNGGHKLTMTGNFTNFGGNNRIYHYGGTSVLELAGAVNLSNDATNRTLTLVGNGGTNYIISGVIQNGGGSAASNFSNTSSGTVTISGNNTYTGTTGLGTSGTTIVASNTAFSSSVVSLLGGTLQGDGTARTLANDFRIVLGTSTIGGASDLTFNGNLSNDSGNYALNINNTGATTFAGTVNLGGGIGRTLTLGGTGNATISGVVQNGAGTSNLIKTGTGTLTMSGNNTYTGTTTLTAGTIAAGHNSALGSGTLILNGGTLRASGAARTLANTLTLSADSGIDGSENLTLNGTLTNNNGNRTLTVNNTGTTTLAGTINLSNDATSRTLTIGGTGNSTISGVVQNGGGSAAGVLAKSGSGTLTLSGNNTYTGGTTLTAGTIAVGHNNALGTGALNLNGGTLQGDGTARTLANTVTLTAGSTIGGSSDLTLNGTFTNSGASNTLTVNNSGTTTLGGTVNLSNDATNRTLTIAGTGNMTMSGVVQNGGGSTASSLSKNGASTLILSGNNTYAGTTTVGSSGIIAAGSDTAFGTGILNLAFGGTLRADGGARTLANNISMLDHAGISGSSDLTLNGAFTVGNGTNLGLNITNSGVTTFGGIFSLSTAPNASTRSFFLTNTNNVNITGIIQNGGAAPCNISKAGAGTATFSGNNTYSGTTSVTAGTLVAGSNTAFGTSTLINGNGTWSGDGTARTLANNMLMGGNFIIGGSSDLTFTGTFTNSQGTGVVTVNNSGTTTFSGQQNLSHDATNRTVTWAGTGAINITGNVVNGGTATASNIGKTGAGLLTLSGNNTYAGTTTISSSGAVAIGSNTAFGTSAVTLSGGSLQGDGTARTISNNITQTGFFTIQGSSDLTLNGSYTNSGANNTLTVNNSGTTTIGGTVNLSNDNTGRSLSIAGSGGLTMSGVIQNGGSSAGSLNLNSSGIMTVSGNNTYSGTTTLGGANGTVVIGNDNAFGTSAVNLGIITMRGDGTARTIANNLTLNTSSHIIGGSSDLTFNGTFTNNNDRTFTVNNSGTTTFGGTMSLSNSASNRIFTFAGTGNVNYNGVIQNGGTSTTSAIVKSGSGMLTLGNANTYGGTTTLTAGTLAAGHNTAFSTNTLILNGGTLRASGASRTLANTLTLSADSGIDGSEALTLNGTLTNNNGNRTLTVNNSALTTLAGAVQLSNDTTNRTLTIGGTGNTTISGVVQKTAGGGTASNLTKTGSGMLTLSGANTYGGTTRLQAGSLAVGNNTAVGTGALELEGGTLRASGAARTLANAVNLQANTIIDGSEDLILNGTFTNSGGNRTLTTNNTGLTTLGGTVNLSNDATDRTLTIGGTGNTAISGVIQNGGTSTTSSFVKTGAGTATFAGANTYAGTTTVNGGSLRLGASNRIADASAVTVGASGTFDLAGFSETFTSITNNGAVTMGTGSTLTTSGAQTHTGTVTGNGVTLASSGGGAISATNALNDFTGNLAISTSSTASIADANSLALGTVGSSTFFAQAHNGDITLNGQITASQNNGTSITLVASDQFINNTGAAALQLAGTADWLVYSNNRANDTRGSLSGFSRYGCTYNAGSPSCAAGTDIPVSGNGFYLVTAPTLTISGLSGVNRVYDATDDATLTGTAALNGVYSGDTVTIDASAMTADFADKNVGNGKAITVAGYALGGTNYGYLLSQPTGVTANITKADLNVTGLTAGNKVYNGNTIATLGGTAAVTALGLDVVTLGGTAEGTFADKHVGNGKAVTVTGVTLGGADAGNYNLIQQTGLTANITPRTLQVTASAGQNKTYGDANPVSYTYTHDALQAGDTAAIFSGSLARVAGENAGSYAINQNTLSAGSNYTISYTPSSFTINKANLRVKAVDLSYTAGSGVPVVTFLYEPTDFKFGQNATTAGLIGAPTVSNINFSTVGAGTYAMQVGLGGLSSNNYNFSELFPRGILTVTSAAAPVITQPTELLPDTVRQVMNDASILYTGSASVATSGTNDAGNTNSGKRRDTNANAGSTAHNVNLYDVSTGQLAVTILDSIDINPALMRAFGLTYNSRRPNI